MNLKCVWLCCSRPGTEGHGASSSRRIHSAGGGCRRQGRGQRERAWRQAVGGLGQGQRQCGCGGAVGRARQGAGEGQGKDGARAAHRLSQLPQVRAACRHMRSVCNSYPRAASRHMSRVREIIPHKACRHMPGVFFRESSCAHGFEAQTAPWDKPIWCMDIWSWGCRRHSWPLQHVSSDLLGSVHSLTWDCVHRSVITDPSGQIVNEIAGPSSSSDASGSTAGSTVDSLSGSEGMAPIQTVCILNLPSCARLCETLRWLSDSQSSGNVFSQSSGVVRNPQQLVLAARKLQLVN